MFEFFVLSSPLIWIPLLLAFVVVEAILVNNDKYGVSTLVLLAVLFGLQFFSDIKPFSLALSNPLAFIGVLGAYFLAGVGYAYIKWLSHVHQKVDAISELIEEGLKFYASTINGEDKVAAEKQRAAIIKSASSKVLGYDKTLPIQVSENKARIMGWMAYWPVSAAFTLFDDPIRRAFQFAYRRLAGGLQRVSDRASAKIDNKYGVGK